MTHHDDLTESNSLTRGFAHGFGLALFALPCMIWSPLALVIFRTASPGRYTQIGRKVISYSFRTYLRILIFLKFIRLEVEGFENLSRDDACLIAPNHPSLIDAVLILALFPRACCVLKSSLLANPLFHGSASLAGYISNHNTRKMIHSAIREIRSGYPVLMFPEGTRTTGGKISSLKLSPFLIAQRAGCDIQTILIESQSKYLGKEWPLQRPPKLPVHITIRAGKRFPSSTDVRTNASILENYYRDSL